MESPILKILCVILVVTKKTGKGGTTKHMGVSKNRGENPKMDGENNGKPY